MARTPATTGRRGAPGVKWDYWVTTSPSDSRTLRSSVRVETGLEDLESLPLRCRREPGVITDKLKARRIFLGSRQGCG